MKIKSPRVWGGLQAGHGAPSRTPCRAKPTPCQRESPRPHGPAAEHPGDPANKHPGVLLAHSEPTTRWRTAPSAGMYAYVASLLPLMGDRHPAVGWVGGATGRVFEFTYVKIKILPVPIQTLTRVKGVCVCVCVWGGVVWVRAHPDRRLSTSPACLVSTRLISLRRRLRKSKSVSKHGQGGGFTPVLPSPGPNVIQAAR